MKITFPVKLAAISSLLLSSFPLLLPAKASQFTETAIDQTQVIAIARPYGDRKYDLLVIEQIPKKKQCWAENGMNPVLVDPLLLNFDFTGICRRSTDSNGYSVRLDGEDYGLEYLLRIVPKANELVLIGTSRSGKAPEIIIGSTQGLASGFMKIILKPGWQFSKRTFNNKVLGHFYFSGKQADVLNPINISPSSPVTLPSVIPEPSITPFLPVPVVPNSTPLPTPTPTSLPSPISTPFPSPTPTSLPSPISTPDPSSTPSPTFSPSPSPTFFPAPSPTPSSMGKPKTGQTKPSAKPATLKDFRTPY